VLYFNEFNEFLEVRWAMAHAKGRWGAHLPCSQGYWPIGRQTTKSETHGQCDDKHIWLVTFPAAEHHCPLPGTKLYCLVTEAHGCELW